MCKLASLHIPVTCLSAGMPVNWMTQRSTHYEPRICVTYGDYACKRQPQCLPQINNLPAVTDFDTLTALYWTHRERMSRDPTAARVHILFPAMKCKYPDHRSNKLRYLPSGLCRDLVLKIVYCSKYVQGRLKQCIVAVFPPEYIPRASYK